MMSHAPTTHWTAAPATGVAIPLVRAHLVARGGGYRLDTEGPPAAVFVASAGNLSIDDDPTGGMRLAVNDAGRVTLY